ncbi:hypothetical protein ACW9KT_14875 [Hymenobacter sp. HD11105]
MLKTLRSLDEQTTPALQKPFQLLNWLETVILLGCAVLTVTIIGWSLPRGFDVFDESFYLLGYRYPGEYEASFSAFHLLIARGLGLVDCSVITYRWLGLLFNVLGAIVFAWSFARWQRTVAPDSSRPLVITVCYVTIGSLLVFSIFPRTLSYNNLNSFLLLLGGAAMLQTLSRGPSGSIWLVIVGIATGLDVFVKLSTSFLILGSELLLLIWCWQQQGVRVIGKALLMLGLGIAAGLAFYFVRVQPPLVWYHNLTQEMSVIQTSGGYGIKDLLPSYLKAARLTIRFMLYPMGPTLFLLIALAWWWPRQSPLAVRRWSILISLLVLAGLYTGWQAIRRHWYLTGSGNDHQSLPLLLSSLVLAAGVLLVLPTIPAGTSQAKAPSQLLPVGCWLFALPFLASAGTGNDLRVNLLIDAGPWFAVLLLLTGLHSYRLPMWVNSSLLLLPAVWCAEQVVWGTLLTPYALRQPMSKQVVPLQTAGLKTALLVDSATATFFNQLTYLLAKGGFRPGDPILGFYDLPGLVYVSGGISPGMQWYFSNRDVRTFHALDITQLPISKAYIITNRSLDEGTEEQLRARGINFPQHYRLVGTLTNTCTINWSPDNCTFSVYAPLPLHIVTSSQTTEPL